MMSLRGVFVLLPQAYGIRVDLTNSNYTELASAIWENTKIKVGVAVVVVDGGGKSVEIIYSTHHFGSQCSTQPSCIDATGHNAAPVYKFLKSSKVAFVDSASTWNFAKFLVDKDGHVVDCYAPTTSPLSLRLK
ncbi:glutathione peroxidase [Cinnamomum micranthum f. kanehirae]|uniref:Glutathione peroxidase n=1 Tax=Cinnamomum micranthum f. kanehirae TaxID=337451 RepID=A0A443PBE0_9MAGN|nr:glutathione peroxidase [Cinnamomum micranthum f. kanehirae]